MQNICCNTQYVSAGTNRMRIRLLAQYETHGRGGDKQYGQLAQRIETAITEYDRGNDIRGTGGLRGLFEYRLAGLHRAMTKG